MQRLLYRSISFWTRNFRQHQGKHTAIASGDLDAARLARWRKLQREDTYNTQSVADARKRDKQFGKMVSKAMSDKQRNQRN